MLPLRDLASLPPNGAPPARGSTGGCFERNFGPDCRGCGRGEAYKDLRPAPWTSPQIPAQNCARVSAGDVLGAGLGSPYARNSLCVSTPSMDWYSLHRFYVSAPLPRRLSRSCWAPSTSARAMQASVFYGASPRRMVLSAPLAPRAWRVRAWRGVVRANAHSLSIACPHFGPKAAVLTSLIGASRDFAAPPFPPQWGGNGLGGLHPALLPRRG